MRSLISFRSIAMYFLCFSGVFCIPYGVFGQNITNITVGQIFAAGSTIFSTMPSAATSSNVWMTSFVFASSRNDFAGTLGCKFKVGATNITITQLGRWVYDTNGTQSHRMGLWDTAGTLLGSVTNSTVGKSVGFTYTILASPIVLNAGTTNTIGSQEFSGGDLWSDSSINYATTGTATNISSAHLGGAFVFPSANAIPNAVYVGVNFIYQ